MALPSRRVGMSERVKWITHKGEQILFSNYSGLDEGLYLKELEETMALLKSAVDQKPPYLLALTDVSNTTTTAKITEKSKQCGTLFKGVKATAAIVGVTETKKVITRIVSPDLRVFESPEKAKDWLVAQARNNKCS
jgi:hypothetical protein